MKKFLSVGALVALSALAIAAALSPQTLGDALPYIVAGGLMPVNAERLGAAFTGFKTLFNQRFQETMTYWDRVSTQVPSSAAEEKYGWLGQFPRLREWVGDRHVKGLTLSDYSIKNKKFEATVGVPREYYERDTYGVMNPMFQEMGYSAKTHPDELVFALAIAGFSTVCYDGQFFFDTDHPVNGVSVSNTGGGSGAPWMLLDTRRPLKPFILQMEKPYQLVSMQSETDENVFMRGEFLYGVDARCNVGFGFWQQAYGSKATLDAAAFNAGRLAMEKFTSEDGRPLGVSPNLLVCGPTRRAEAEALLLAQLTANGGSNTNFKAVDLLVVSWLG